MRLRQGEKRRRHARDAALGRSFPLSLATHQGRPVVQPAQFNLVSCTPPAAPRAASGAAEDDVGRVAGQPAGSFRAERGRTGAEGARRVGGASDEGDHAGQGLIREGHGTQGGVGGQHGAKHRGKEARDWGRLPLFFQLAVTTERKRRARVGGGGARRARLEAHTRNVLRGPPNKYGTPLLPVAAATPPPGSSCSLPALPPCSPDRRLPPARPHAGNLVRPKHVAVPAGCRQRPARGGPARRRRLPPPPRLCGPVRV